MTPIKKSTIYFPDRAPIQVSVEVELKSSPQDVWNVLTDSPGWYDWYEGVTSCETTSTTPAGVGGTRKIVVGGAEFCEEFIAYEPMKVWGFSVYDMKPLVIATKMVERVVFEPIEQEDGSTGTRLKYAAGIEPTLITKILRPWIVYKMTGSWTRSLQGIDAYLEKKNANST
jgi:uncharacterized protein YndB with AHSA1/START domain